MPKLQRGSSVPLFIVITLILLAIPAYYWLSLNNFNFSTSSKNVRGVASIGNVYDKPGFSVTVTSTAETWDLVEYLCSSREECLETLDSGKRLGTISGGSTELHEVFVEYSPKWDEYAFIKFYVRPGWSATQREFKIANLGDIPGATREVVSDGTYIYEVVIAPVVEVKNTFYRSAYFTDL